MKILRRPKRALDLDQTVEVLLAFSPSAPGPFEEFVEVLAQYQSVRVPIVGYCVVDGAE